MNRVLININSKMSIKPKRAILFFFFIGGFVSITNAQIGTNYDSLITISGKVNCIDPLNGKLSFVSIYNTRKEWGTFSDSIGNYSIKMGVGDTIVFFTEQHKDYLYFLEDENQLMDHKMDVYMEPDAIWLETVNIIGLRSLEDFKREILNMNIKENDISVSLPVVKKYAMRFETGEGGIILVGPLTYLQQKFQTQYFRKKNIHRIKDD